MTSYNKTIITFSHLDKGHGAFSRHKRMAEALSRKGNNVIWIGKKIKFKEKITIIPLRLNFLPNLGFIGLYVKIFFTIFLNLKKINRADSVLAIREYDAFCLFLNPFLKNANKVFFSRGDVISILKINLSDQKNKLRYLIDLLTIYSLPIIQKSILKRSNQVIFQADFLYEIYQERHKKNKITKIILPNDCQFNSNEKNRHIKKIDQNFINLGFISPLFWSCKGLGLIVEMVRLLEKNSTNFVLHIGGDGPGENKLKLELQKIIKNNNNIKWYGWVKNVESFFSKIDLLIVPSLYDSNPNIVLEALSKSVPMLASNIPAHREMLKYDILQFEIDRIDKMVKKINSFQNSAEQRLLIKENIQLRKKSLTFDWDNKINELIIFSHKSNV
tara:strand:- start:161 stop:1321 length:1161 start_codon:yes stop_codon:yes gene_type:complete